MMAARSTPSSSSAMCPLSGSTCPQYHSFMIANKQALMPNLAQGLHCKAVIHALHTADWPKWPLTLRDFVQYPEQQMRCLKESVIVQTGRRPFVSIEHAPHGARRGSGAGAGKPPLATAAACPPRTPLAAPAPCIDRHSYQLSLFSAHTHIAWLSFEESLDQMIAAALDTCCTAQQSVETQNLRCRTAARA